MIDISFLADYNKHREAPPVDGWPGIDYEVTVTLAGRLLLFIVSL